ncbi:MAG: DUF433 domain-containing protein [Chloroflexi bacterium]|jgi:uncharacterized protein (DUF433 family)|nr:DUF433 domain-containing protein [Chloroflexota bacterium]
MTIKWVHADPLVMNGEPFLYGTRLTVRRLLELRASGFDGAQLLKEMPELRIVGIVRAYEFAVTNREHYAEFFDSDGTLLGPDLTPAELALV